MNKKNKKLEKLKFRGMFRKIGIKKGKPRKEQKNVQIP